MPVVLGIDAAWTEHGSSGIALLRVSEGTCNVVAVTPSYAGFIGLAKGELVDWRRPPGGVPFVPELLAAAASLGGAGVDVVAIDMPMSRVPIEGRRPADRAISSEFGGRGAAVHSPNSTRPDRAVTQMVKSIEDEGFKLATRLTDRPALIEVYPLAALTRFLCVHRRPAYKVSKIARYGWSGDVKDRIDQLLANWAIIREELERQIGPIGIDLPERALVNSASQLKPYEDAIDAVVSAWIGMCFVAGEAEPFPVDDPDAAIWIPKPPAPEAPRIRNCDNRLIRTLDQSGLND